MMMIPYISNIPPSIKIIIVIIIIIINIINIIITIITIISPTPQPLKPTPHHISIIISVRTHQR